jgi:hypothetical protein
LHSDFEANSPAPGDISIYGMLDGMVRYQFDHGIQFHGVQSPMESIRVTGKPGFSNHRSLEHFRFFKGHTQLRRSRAISEVDIRRRIGKTAKYVVLDRFRPSPQCGFASTEEGNIGQGRAMGEAPDGGGDIRRGVGLDAVTPPPARAV